MSFASSISHLASITGLPEELFARLSDEGLIAGGSILSGVVKEKTGETIETSDVDVFLPKFRKNDFERFNRICAIVSEYCTYKIINKGKTDSVFNLERSEGLPIQIILRSEDVEGILDTFDFDVCQVGIYQGKFYGTESVLSSIDERVCRTFGSFMSENGRKRAEKMIKKGFQVVYIPETYELEDTSLDGSLRGYLKPVNLGYTSGVRCVDPVYVGYKIEGRHLTFDVEMTVLNSEETKSRFYGWVSHDPYYEPWASNVLITPSLPIHLALFPKKDKPFEYTCTHRMTDQLIRYVSRIYSEGQIDADGEEKLYEVIFEIKNEKLHAKILGILPDSYLPPNIQFDFLNFGEEIEMAKKINELIEKLSTTTKELASVITRSQVDKDLIRSLFKVYNM